MTGSFQLVLYCRGLECDAAIHNRRVVILHLYFVRLSNFVMVVLLSDEVKVLLKTFKIGVNTVHRQQHIYRALRLQQLLLSSVLSMDWKYTDVISFISVNPGLFTAG